VTCVIFSFLIYSAREHQVENPWFSSFIVFGTCVTSTLWHFRFWRRHVWRWNPYGLWPRV